MIVFVTSGSTGSFAEDKDAARDLRINSITPALDEGLDVTIDFSAVDLATQSFVHALLSDLIRSRGSEVLDRLVFRGCNDTLRGLIGLVVDYSQAGLDEPEVV